MEMPLGRENLRWLNYDGKIEYLPFPMALRWYTVPSILVQRNWQKLSPIALPIMVGCGLRFVVIRGSIYTQPILSIG